MANVQGSQSRGAGRTAEAIGKGKVMHGRSEENEGGGL